jgi:small subunit ribosomal protein S6
MPLYEHVFLARQDISAQQVESLLDTYRALIEENGGTVGKTEYWGLKSLAYRIKKNRKAHYTLINMDAPHEAVAEMERQMGLSTDVIRFITIRVDEHETEPSAMMRRSDRDDRGGRGDRERHQVGRRDRNGGSREDRAEAAGETGEKDSE